LIAFSSANNLFIAAAVKLLSDDRRQSMRDSKEKPPPKRQTGRLPTEEEIKALQARETTAYFRKAFTRPPQAPTGALKPEEIEFLKRRAEERFRQIFTCLRPKAG
jgi:hypothetical protein